ncbi:hypothetical protein BKI52_19450 [marine bacterium AO1-C]|nr:hypothetical protein BKI52_19450 [marine bacterium AO1-C]
MQTSKTISDLAQYLLECLNIAYTKPSVQKYFASSPDDGTLSSLTDLLDLYRIPNITAQLQPTQLKEIDLPAVVQLQQGKEGNLVVLHTYNADQVSYYDLDQGMLEVPSQQFIKQWTGVTLLMIPDDLSAEPQYAENRKKIQRKKWDQYIGRGLLLGLIASGAALMSHWLPIALLVASMAGLVVSVLLLMNQIGQTDTLLHKLCNLNKATSCKAVTESNQSSFLGWLSWAEVGSLYFSGHLLALLLLTVLQQTHLGVIPLAMFSALTMPYIVFSIYYQGVVVKKWCTLCLITQGVLVLSFALLLPTLASIEVIDFNILAMVISAFILPLGIWLAIRNKVLKPSESALEIQGIQFMRNQDLFTTFLDKQPYHYIQDLPQDIHLGNSDAPTKILMISNPFCDPCAQAHTHLKDLLAYYNQEIELTIRFLPLKDLDDDRNLIIRHLISLKNSPQIHQALNDWYLMQDYDQWKALYPVDKLTDPVILQENDQWIDDLKVEATPTIFIQGKRLEMPYYFAHLKYHLRNIIEQSAVYAS